MNNTKEFILKHIKPTCDEEGIDHDNLLSMKEFYLEDTRDQIETATRQFMRHHVHGTGESGVLNMENQMRLSIADAIFEDLILDTCRHLI